ncbi:putative beta-D-xylosidase 6 [Acorus calamus]|uniref:Beta-D-xylosidase 6 n=1 Tax=Acorus calamus TaxID=4465 RepID=A0AAV9FES7_ACOCL|nr:putative beta-D-xylosidase 6 [Acorus calamus]
MQIPKSQPLPLLQHLPPHPHPLPLPPLPPHPPREAPPALQLRLPNPPPRPPPLPMVVRVPPRRRLQRPGRLLQWLHPRRHKLPPDHPLRRLLQSHALEVGGGGHRRGGAAMHDVGQAGLTFWAPNINVFRDPRWGRGQETPGEDPMVAAAYAVEYVLGFQGEVGGGGGGGGGGGKRVLGEDVGGGRMRLSACCKHFTAYDLEKWGGFARYTFNAKVTEQDMEDTYQPPFRGCIEEGHASCLMCSYNQVNGVPACARHDLLNKARNEWGFKGKVSEEDIDRALLNLFTVQMRLGIFDGENQFGNLGPWDVCTEKHRELALDAARQGIVLLKNDNQFLPLKKVNIASLAVIGPAANDTSKLGGGYSGVPCNPISLFEGLQAYVERASYASGCLDIACQTEHGFKEAIHIARNADVVVVVAGIDLTQETEDLDRVSLLLPGRQTIS